ncbi:MAG: GDYXXLXY domain-containing protein [Symbiobacteriaceae bacterium]|nr:GDYXXLXY domain-containing protein [Symbiobacteriaceae bacterium]
MNKYLKPALLLTIIIQLTVPTFMIASRYYILRTGEEYLFRVTPIDPYDPFRGRYVTLNITQRLWGQGSYGIIEVDQDGFATIVALTATKPENSPYLRSSQQGWFTSPVDRYYMNENFAPEAQRLFWQETRDSEKEVYVAVRIKNGELVISGLFIEGVAIEEILRK